MHRCAYTAALCLVMLSIPVIVSSLPVYETDFVVHTDDTSTDSILEKVLVFVNELGTTFYSHDNITVSHV